MSLKNAAFLALIGMIVLTVLMLFDFVSDVSADLQGLIPAVRVLRSAIYLFASLTVAVFFFASYKHGS
jgi:hypothetical protein